MNRCQLVQWSLLALGFALFSAAGVNAAEDGTLGQARRLLLTGNYVEAAELYDQLAATNPAEAAVGKARCLLAQGEVGPAVEVLKQALAVQHDSSNLLGELATVSLQQGEHESASEYAAAALKHDENNLAARWTLAELDRTAGKLTEAEAKYRWLIDYYNRADVLDAESELWVARAASQYARWNRLHDQFEFLVQDLLPGAVKREKELWTAHYEAGLLFGEKYNEPEAVRQFTAALAINPRAAEVHAALAALAVKNFELSKAKEHLDRALKINPSLLEAKQVEADLQLLNFQRDAARETLEDALRLNPRSEKTLGRMAAVSALVSGEWEQLLGTEAGKLIAEVEARNPHAGEFYAAAADTFDLVRKYPAAAHFFTLATEKMPRLVRAHGDLGMIYMRLGREVEGRRVLEEAFKIDPYNVRVRNTLQVLDVLSGYATIETEHFVIKFDRAHDELLAEHAAEYLESHVFPEICERMGYEPQEKTLLEIFSNSGSTSGHSWFSARMVGLPNIGTIGACAGQMFALTSPTSIEQQFNWSRVLKHEFVHIVNLQQTDFNIPHWYTEGLAVSSEGVARPASWNDLLVRRHAQGRLFNLDTVNFGFLRPESQQDWNLAYCQATLYTDLLEQLGGPTVHRRMLQAYQENLDTGAALQKTLNLSQQDFEEQFQHYVAQQVSRIRNSSGAASADAESVEELKKRLEQKPDDADLLAQLAHVHLDAKDSERASSLATQAIQQDPKQPLASFVLAKLQVQAGNRSDATKLLESTLDREKPIPAALALLASLKQQQGDLDATCELLELGARTLPLDAKWDQALVRLYLSRNDRERLATVLGRMAAADPDNFIVRKKLVQLAQEAQKPDDVIRWAEQGLAIDILDADLHRALALALADAGQRARAARALASVLRLKPDDSEARIASAENYVELGQHDEAITALNKLIEQQPDHPRVRGLLEKLSK